MTVGALPLAFVAGVLSILSPCVLPILPVVLGAAASEHRWGAAPLAGGLSVSFVAIGLFAATIGYSIGLDTGVFRNAAAMLMIVVGAILLVPRFQVGLALAGAPLANLSRWYVGVAPQGGLPGQMLVGLMLGAVWSPCVGPTLGAASLLAAQGHDLLKVALAMFAFGTAFSRRSLPKAFACATARETRGRTCRVSAMEALTAEAALVNASPQWLTDLTTRF